MKKLSIFTLAVFLVFPISVNALEVELTENTDRCIYNSQIDKDYCSAIYRFCSPTFNPSKVNFIFKTANDKIYRETLKDLDFETEIENLGDKCYKIKIEAHKNPYQDIDHVFGYDGDFAFEYAWWNSSYPFKIPFYCFCPNCVGDLNNMTMLLSNSTYNVGMYINTSLELAYGVIPTVNNSWRICSYVYFNDSSNYVVTDETNTYQINTFINEGNSSNYGTYSDSVLARYYMKNETTVIDRSIYENDCSAVSDPKLTIGQIGHGVDLDSDDYFDCGDHDTEQGEGQSAFTIATWINSTDSADDRHIISKWSAGQLAYAFVKQNSDNLRFYVAADTTIDVTSTNTLSLNTWHFVVGVFNGTHAKVYIDGGLDGISASSTTGNIASVSEQMLIGSTGYGVAYSFQGVIDEVIIENRTWTDQEIMLYYNNTIGTHNVTQFGNVLIPIPIPTSIELIFPSNNYFVIDTTPTHTFNVAGGSPTYDCTLFYNGSSVGNNNSVVNNTVTSIQVNESLNFGSYEWFINCSWDGLEKQSEQRNIIIGFCAVNPVIKTTTPNWWEFWKESGMIVDFVIDCGTINRFYSFSPEVIYLFAHTGDTQNITGSGIWMNVSFDEEESFKSGINHTYSDDSNNTFTITNAGIYDISYHMTFTDSAPNPTGHVEMRILHNDIEIHGSLLEEDSSKQYNDFTITNGVIVYLNPGDRIKIQFTADDTTIGMDSHTQYGEHKDTAVLKIRRIGV